MEKQYFNGLRLDDYIHPAEKKKKAALDNNLISGALDKINDLNVSLVRQITLGLHVAITENTAPDVDAIVKDVCKILDYPHIPKVYICHKTAKTMFGAGTDREQITMSDYMLEHFDTDMLYFAFGNQISMFKSGHVKMVTANAMMDIAPMATIAKLPLQSYLRAADLTSDRGGLLACQSIVAVLKAILWEAGIPVSEIQNMSEQQIIDFSESYIKAIEESSSDWMAYFAGKWESITMDYLPPALRIKELLMWYKNGYEELVGKWK